MLGGQGEERVAQESAGVGSVAGERQGEWAQVESVLGQRGAPGGATGVQAESCPRFEAGAQQESSSLPCLASPLVDPSCCWGRTPGLSLFPGPFIARQVAFS